MDRHVWVLILGAAGQHGAPRLRGQRAASDAWGGGLDLAKTMRGQAARGPLPRLGHIEDGAGAARGL